MKKFLLSIGGFVITAGICWGAAEITYAILKVDIERQVTREEDINRLNRVSRQKINYMIDNSGPYRDYHRIDPALGWSIRENAVAGLYRSNAIGIRGDRNYPRQKPAHIRLRLAAFGDSFTHSDDVANEHTWQSAMERSQDDIEVMNFGVGGYGTDQAWLRYRQSGKDFGADIVLIGFMVENINRNANYFVPFYRRLSSPAGKPRFTLVDGELMLHENPLRSREDYKRLRDEQKTILRQLGKLDYFYQRVYQGPYDLDILRLVKYITVNITSPWVLDHRRQYNTRSEPYRVTLAIMENFYREVEKAGGRPIIVIFPETEDVILARENKPKRHQPLLDDLARKNLEHVDVLDGFRRHRMLDISRLFKGHFTPEGNEYVARILLEYIDGLRLPVSQ